MDREAGREEEEENCKEGKIGSGKREKRRESGKRGKTRGERAGNGKRGGRQPDAIVKHLQFWEAHGWLFPMRRDTMVRRTPGLRELGLG